jgi:hypothetical protein
MADIYENEITMKLTFIAIACITATLTACGGGGGGGGGDSAASIPTQTTPSSSFALTAKINGVAVNGFTVNAGEAKVLGLITGQEVEITASAPSVFVNRNTAFGKAAADVRSDTPTVFRAVLTSSDHTTAKLVFAMASDLTGSTVATITLTIRGDSPNFNAVRPTKGDAFTYADNDKRLDGVAVPFPNSKHVVTSVDSSTGAWNESFFDPSNVATSNVNFNAQGNRVAYQATAADPKGCQDARFDPEEKLLTFPLAVGLTYSSTWTTRCLPNDSQVETISAVVKAYEQVTTPGGVFNALRIEQFTKVTDSTDVRLLPAGKGYEQNVTVWFDPILGRNVKYSGVRTYPGGTPTDPTQFLSETNIQLINTIKN